MPLNPTPVGDSIAAFVKAHAPSPGTPVTDGDLKTLWEGIMKIIYDDIKANALVSTTGTVISGAGVPGNTQATGSIT